jgi:hypothetical protein
VVSSEHFFLILLVVMQLQLSKQKVMQLQKLLWCAAVNFSPLQAMMLICPTQSNLRTHVPPTTICFGPSGNCSRTSGGSIIQAFLIQLLLFSEAKSTDARGKVENSLQCHLGRKYRQPVCIHLSRMETLKISARDSPSDPTNVTCDSKIQRPLC